jgi:phosphomannomutase/phosphoglucomutase
MKIAQHIFREYDIRGYIDRDLSDDFAYVLGQAYAQAASAAGKNDIAIGYDCRPTSKPYAQALARGIASQGLNACLIGTGPTSLVYYAVFNKAFGGGIQVTGSHNPSDMNGFKICIGKVGLSGAEIQDLKQRAMNFAEKFSGQASELSGKISEQEVLPEYIQFMIDNCSPFIGKKKLKVVVDAGNGVGGLAGPAVLRALKQEVIEMYCEPDGTFPNHHPDPSVPENLKDLVERVVAEKADLGIAWDGDADRIGIVSEKGEIIYGDMLVLILARRIIEEKPNAKIIADVKCSSLLFNDVRKRGAEAIMWKTGHSLIKTKLKETGADLAGEMSGHIFFGHRFFGFDCGIYCAARLIELLSNTDECVSDLLKDLPKTVSTPEIRVECPEDVKFRVVEQARESFKDYRVDLTDGVRIEFSDGWGLIRASNTQPVLVLRFEANSAESLSEYQKLVSEKLAALGASYDPAREYSH